MKYLFISCLATLIAIVSIASYRTHYSANKESPTQRDLNILEEFKESHPNPTTQKMFSPLRRDPSWLKNCDSSMFQSLVKDYPFEEYSVTTDDGYILKLFRIQAKGTTMVQTGKKPVYLQHCLVCSADDYVVNTEANALGLVLANKGYDVWLGNNRGNKYSLDHTTLSSYSEAFWDYSFQHMGMYDVPAFLKFIIQRTGVEKVTYFGHS